jgi:hypothetical protein
VAKLARGSKPTYYIWKTEDMNNEEVEKRKLYWLSLGFRVVTFIDGSKDIHSGLKAVIKNHIKY